MRVKGPKQRAMLAAIVVFVVLGLAACSRSEPKEKFKAADITDASWGRDFHLIDSAGTPRSLADYRGKVVMLFFGYTNCPDECPATLTKMAQAVDKLGSDGQRVQGLFVTVDPAHDTPALLQQYVSQFHRSFIGLWGNAATIAATAKDFKVFYEVHKADANGNYAVDHQSGIFVFDGRGRLRVYMGPDIWVDALGHDLRLLLNQPPLAPDPVSASEAATAAIAQPPFVPFAITRPVADVLFQDGAGRQRSLSDFRGKVVLLNVWATWCAPCRKEMPTLDRLQSQFGGPDFEVVALSIDRDGAAAVRKFFNETSVHALSVYVDPTTEAMSKLEILGVPTTLLIDRQGREVARQTGIADWDRPEIVATIERYLPIPKS